MKVLAIVVMCLAAWCVSGCGGSALNAAIRTANVVGTTADAAHEEIKVLCAAAVSAADTIEKADQVIATCANAEDAYGALRASWIALAAAIRTAELTGTDPDNLDELISSVMQAALSVEEAIARIKDLAK